MRFLKDYIARQEERLAHEDDAEKRAGPLRLTSFESGPSTGFKSIADMIASTDAAMRAAEQFYSLPSDQHSEFRLGNGNLTYLSPIRDGTANDNVFVRVFGDLRQAKRAVVILPHWNAHYDAYAQMARIISRFGGVALVLMLPHHLLRSDTKSNVANDFLNADLGAAIRSIRQSVLDTKLLIDWLHAQGLQDISLIGASLGSCVASLAATFEPRVSRAVLLLTAGDFAEVVWTGRATRHICEVLEGSIALDELKRIWAIISPSNFVWRLAGSGCRVLVVSGQRDEVVKYDLAQKYVAELVACQANVVWQALPCGHYTLAKPPFNLIALLRTISFLGHQRSRLETINFAA